MSNLQTRRILDLKQVGTGNGAGGGSMLYVRPNPTLITVGGLTSGHTPNGTVQDILDLMLYPYQVPSFTAFQINGQATSIELGDAIAAGSKTFSWATANASNINANSVSLSDVTSPQLLVSGLANDGSEVVSLAAITKSTIASHSWAIAAQNTQGAAFSRQFTVNWRPRKWWGVIDAANLSNLLAAANTQALLGVLGLTLSGNDLVTTKPGAGNYNCSGNKHIWYLWDASIGTATFSSGGFVAPFNLQLVSFTNAFGVIRNYYLYTSVNSFNSATVQMTVI